MPHIHPQETLEKGKATLEAYHRIAEVEQRLRDMRDHSPPKHTFHWGKWFTKHPTFIWLKRRRFPGSRG